MKRVELTKLLFKAGLSQQAAVLYSYVFENAGCSVADACLDLNYSKSTIYRAFDELKKLELVESLTGEWRNSLKAISLGGLIKKMENQRRQKESIIKNLKSFELSNALSAPESLTNFEILNEEDTFERYHDLAKSSDWDTMLAFGNWEGFNNENRCIVPIEKKFINHRLKKGGKAFVVITQDGPNTSQIVDFNNEIDFTEDRKSIIVDDVSRKPIWVSAFEGNDYVHIWNLNDRGKIKSTFMDCKSIADFYKDFIYSRLV